MDTEKNIETTGDVSPLDTAAQLFAEYLYKRTAHSMVTGKKSLLLSPPCGIDGETLALLIAGLGTEESHALLEKTAWIQGKKDVYYYDSHIMTPQYAQLQALMEDKDILVTISTVTRSDSKLYPRPTLFRKLEAPPFRFTKDEILGSVARMKNEPEYQDIGVVTASNGSSGLYSEKFLSRRYAQSLIELFEVEQVENP